MRFYEFSIISWAEVYADLDVRFWDWYLLDVFAKAMRSTCERKYCELHTCTHVYKHVCMSMYNTEYPNWDWHHVRDDVRDDVRDGVRDDVSVDVRDAPVIQTPGGRLRQHESHDSWDWIAQKMLGSARGHVSILQARETHREGTTCSWSIYGH